MAYSFERKTDGVDDVMAQDINELQVAIEEMEAIIEGGAAIGGWIEVPDSSWSYASSTTINVPAGAMDIYAVGDQVRLKQGGAYKYFSVIAVADTLLTVTGGTDYSVADAVITDAAFSKGGGVGHPVWFNWTPTFSGFSTNPTPVVARYCVVGRLCYLVVKMGFGTSNASIFEMSAPLTAAIITDMAWRNALSFYVNGGTSVRGDGFATLVSGSNTIQLITNTVTWATSGNKLADFQMFYEVAQ